MESRRYTASKTLTKDGNGWIITFRHPLRKDPRGKQGRKVRRGLGTSDENRAQALIDEMNILLGDSSWHSKARQTEAERRFDPIVARAFYDDLESPPFNSWEARNNAMVLPDEREGYARVLMIGTTGAGKTSLLRHLIGSDPKRDRFPSTSASRTTISDIEVIASEDPLYKAIVTFFSESQVYTYAYECVTEACAALWEDLSDEKLAEKLLTHRDLRFRLGYIIGSWKQATPSVNRAPDDWDYDDEPDNIGTLIDPVDGNFQGGTDLENIRLTLESYLRRIRAISAEAKLRLQQDLSIDIENLTGADKEATQDFFEEYVQSCTDFDDLVNDIIDEIRQRFGRLILGTLQTHPNGWPMLWEYETENREEFVKAVRGFSSNDAPAFGKLLTPLVDGIRIQGQFFPSFSDRRARLVLLDGEGLGHVGDPAAGLASRIAKKFGDVNVILLVDSAKAPMLEAPASVLRAVAASGYQHKLAFAFTHFDLLRGQDNLPTLDAQKTHVLSSVHQKLVSLKDVVGQPAIRAIERELDNRCFMLGFLDRPLTERNRGPVKGILDLISYCESAVLPAKQPVVNPVYDTAGLVLAIQAATKDFHTRWDTILGFTPSGNIRTAHWAEIKAFNRRVVLNIDNCEYRDLKPVADFVARLSESITKYLDKPHRWEPRIPSEAEVEEALSRVQREVFNRLHAFVEKILLSDPRKQWNDAFESRGRGSTSVRKKVIQTIYDTSAPIPGPALDSISEQFLREVRLLVHEAIRSGGGKLINDVLGVPINP